MNVVTFELAKSSLRITHDFEDADIQSYLDMAQALVFDYIKRPFDAAKDTTDGVLQAATLRMLSHLWENRGADDVTAAWADGYLPRNVTMFLHRKRDPALA